MPPAVLVVVVGWVKQKLEFSNVAVDGALKQPPGSSVVDAASRQGLVQRALVIDHLPSGLVYLVEPPLTDEFIKLTHSNSRPSSVRIDAHTSANNSVVTPNGITSGSAHDWPSPVPMAAATAATPATVVACCPRCSPAVVPRVSSTPRRNTCRAASLRSSMSRSA